MRVKWTRQGKLQPNKITDARLLHRMCFPPLGAGSRIDTFRVNVPAPIVLDDFDETPFEHLVTEAFQQPPFRGFCRELVIRLCREKVQDQCAIRRTVANERHPRQNCAIRCCRIDEAGTRFAEHGDKKCRCLIVSVEIFACECEMCQPMHKLDIAYVAGDVQCDTSVYDFARIWQHRRGLYGVA